MERRPRKRAPGVIELRPVRVCRDWGGAIRRGSEDITGVSSPVTPTAHSSSLLTALHRPPLSCTGNGLHQTRGRRLVWEGISVGVGRWTT